MWLRTGRSEGAILYNAVIVTVYTWSRYVEHRYVYSERKNIAESRDRLTGSGNAPYLRCPKRMLIIVDPLPLFRFSHRSTSLRLPLPFASLSRSSLFLSSPSSPGLPPSIPFSNPFLCEYRQHFLHNA